MSNADKLRAIRNTLETLMIPATGENVGKLTGIYQLMNDVIGELTEQEANHEPEAE